MNILIVENDIAIASGLKKLIEMWGHNVEKVRIGKEALTVFDQDFFDLALLDIKGCELIPQLKNLHPEIGIVAMTSYNTPELEMKVREQGVWYYMIQPFEIEELQSLLDHVCRKQGQKNTQWKGGD